MGLGRRFLINIVGEGILPLTPGSAYCHNRDEGIAPIRRLACCRRRAGMPSGYLTAILLVYFLAVVLRSFLFRPRWASEDPWVPKGLCNPKPSTVGPTSPTALRVSLRKGAATGEA